MVRESRKPWRGAAAIVFAVVVCGSAAFFANGCGGAPTRVEVSVHEQSRPTTTFPIEAAASPSTSTHSVPSPDSVYLVLAKELAPILVYAPTYLPAGATLAESWWPVLQVANQGDYEGPTAENPRVDSADEGRSVSAEVLYEVGDGWLVMLENFRGDLGDVAGQVVGNIEGRQVRTYVYDGCVVAQWSEDGSWYAVFGRNVEAAEVTKVALSSAKVRF